MRSFRQRTSSHFWDSVEGTAVGELRAELGQVFADIDLDQSGTINRREFLTVARSELLCTAR